MISKFITRVQRSTKRASASMLPVALMFILMMIVLTNYMYRQQMLQYNYENIENSLVDSLLASSVVNLTELVRNGDIVIDTATSGVSTQSCFDRSYEIFRDIFVEPNDSTISSTSTPQSQIASRNDSVINVPSGIFWSSSKT